MGMLGVVLALEKIVLRVKGLASLDSRAQLRQIQIFGRYI